MAKTATEHSLTKLRFTVCRWENLEQIVSDFKLAMLDQVIDKAFNDFIPSNQSSGGVQLLFYLPVAYLT